MLNLKRRLLTMACTAGMAGSVFALAPANTAFAAVTEEVEENNEQKQANDIDVNTDVTGALETKEDMDFYKFTVKDNGLISIRFQHPEHNWEGMGFGDTTSLYKVAILDQDGEEVTETFVSHNHDTDFTFHSFGISAGTYYVKVTPGVMQADYDYTINVNYTKEAGWEAENNNNADKAQEIQPDTTVSGWINYKDDVDWYKVVLDAPGAVSYTFSHEFVDNEATFWTTKLFYLDNNQEVILVDDQTFIGTDDEEFTSPKAGLPKGTYYLKVTSAKGWTNAGKYSIRMNFDKSSDWESEKNNTMKTANSIDLGTTINGALSVAKDVDYYKFTLSENTNVTMKFEHDINKIVDDNNYWAVTLYSEYEEKLGSYTIVGRTKGTETLDSKTLDAGTYYVQVQAAKNSSTNTYGLSLEKGSVVLNGLQKGSDGNYHYYINGEIDRSKTGVVEFNGEKFYVEKGDLKSDLNGVLIDPNSEPNYVWYFYANGQVQAHHVGMALYDGEWFYIKDGKVQTDMNKFLEYDGGLFAIAAGRKVGEYSGLMQDPENTATGDWYFFAEGQAQKQYTGLAEYDGHWFYVVKGKFDPAYNGTVTYDGAEFTVVNGEAVVK